MFEDRQTAVSPRSHPDVWFTNGGFSARTFCSNVGFGYIVGTLVPAWTGSSTLLRLLAHHATPASHLNLKTVGPLSGSPRQGGEDRSLPPRWGKVQCSQFAV